MNNGHGCLLVSLKNDNVELKSHLNISPRRKYMNKFNTSKGRIKMSWCYPSVMFLAKR